MGISQKAEDDVLISSKAKRKDERGTLDKEISSIFNHIYGNNSYRNRFSKLELNQIVSYYGEIKEIVNPDGDPQYNTSEIKEFLKKKRDTSQYRVKDGFVYQKVTQKIKSKKQKELELEKKRNEENKEKGKSERLNIQKQVKLRFDPKLGFELTLKDCDTIIAEIKPDTPFSINEKDISILCQRVESLRKRYGKYRTLRELFDLEKKNTSNNKGKKEKVVRKCHREPEQNIIGKKLGREGIKNDLDFGGKRKYCGTYDKGSAKEISNQEIDRAFFKIYGTGQKEKNCFSINQRNQVVLYRDEIIKMIDIDSIASEKTVLIKKFLLKKGAAEEKKLQARLRKAERKKQKREIEREKRNIHHDPVLAGKREKLWQEKKEAKIQEQYYLKKYMWGSSF